MSLTQRFTKLPRAIQWAAYAAIVIVLLLVWEQHLFPIADGWNKSAAQIEKNVAQARQGRKVAADLQKQDIQQVVLSLGTVKVPTGEVESAQALNKIINAVLVKHHATDQTISHRARTRLQRTALANIAQGRRVDKMSTDLKFVATPAVALAIIADLESSPDINSIYSVRMTREGNGRVKVQLTLEAWMFGSESPGGPGGVA